MNYRISPLLKTKKDIKTYLDFLDKQEVHSGIQVSHVTSYNSPIEPDHILYWPFKFVTLRQELDKVTHANRYVYNIKYIHVAVYAHNVTDLVSINMYANSKSLPDFAMSD